jgi:hypothetical protein
MLFGKPISNSYRKRDQVSLTQSLQYLVESELPIKVLSVFTYPLAKRANERQPLRKQDEVLLPPPRKPRVPRLLHFNNNSVSPANIDDVTTLDCSIPSPLPNLRKILTKSEPKKY